MTLEEAIKHCEEVAEENERQAEALADFDGAVELQCLECASEHRQLAEWLKELKAYRKAKEEITRKMNSGQWSEGVVYGLNKSIRIMQKHIEEVNNDVE